MMLYICIVLRAKSSSVWEVYESYDSIYECFDLEYSSDRSMFAIDFAPTTVES